ncbi:hypothetical protein JD276_05405 [Leucobacter sp. CSA1]|uniref:Uncharacterized protein n=1 Tax=Leucobacter chromiisoli TaxID=2796471 RepID=A0A934Q4W4_9MICO|nr:hypothetical protein [Leucobacter chromiisoli]MBK0418470.1 hypothetical protein [Leucobacter chromiisoli]
MSEKTRIGAETSEASVEDRAEAGVGGEPAGEPAEAGFAGIASFADAESREILNLLGDDAGGSCCGGSCCSA